jgi:hypothetical protein
VRMVAITGKNLPPSDPGEGVGVCVRVFRVVCCRVSGCMSDVLVRVVTRPLVGGKGGRPRRDHRHGNRPGRYGIVLLCLARSLLSVCTVGRRVPSCVLPVWGQCLFVFLAP